MLGYSDPMSKTIGTPGSKTPRGPTTPTAVPRSPSSKSTSAPTGPLKPAKDTSAKKVEKQADREVARRARAEAARSAKRANPMEEPKDAGDVDQADQDEIMEGLHRQRHGAGHVHKSFGADDELDDLFKSEAEAESGAITDRGISRKGMGGGMGGDGFEGGEDKGREAYEAYLKGNVATDAERMEALRSQGTADTFRPELTPVEVEKLGTPRAAVHMVRLYDAMTLLGKSHAECVDKAKDLLVGFARPESVRKVLQEMESKPIRDVYPLEVLMKILDDSPASLPGVGRGTFIANAADLTGGEKVFAGHPFSVHVPQDVRLKAFALLGGGRPGYEFFPSHDAGKFTMLIDTPGTWQCALLAAPTTTLGRMQRESSEAIIEVFSVRVRAMGKKGDTSDLVSADDDEEDDGDDAGGEAEPDLLAALAEAQRTFSSKPAASLSEQLRPALDAIVKHDAGPKASVYSWDVSLYRPGQQTSGDPVLHVVVDKAGPFDPAWAKAVEAIARKQVELEPSRKPISLMDMQFALKRARAR